MDGLEREWTAGRVIRVNVLTPAGRTFAERHGFQATPTFILFDGRGNEVHRWVGHPPQVSELQ